jgi:hypothetical protein
MIALIKSKRKELARLCGRYRIRRLDVFGSAAEGGFDSGRSDVDLLVEFEPMASADHAECYFGALEALEALFGRPVDLVEAPGLDNPYFLEAIRPTRETIYAT